MALKGKRLIEWNDDAKALLKRVEGSIETVHTGVFKGQDYVKTLTWLKDIRQILLTCDEVEFLGLMMNRYAEPLIYSAVEALDCVMDTVTG